jgi:hypothetical protein
MGKYKEEVITEERIDQLLRLGNEIRPFRSLPRLSESQKTQWLRELADAERGITDQPSWRHSWQDYALVSGIRRLQLVLRLLPIVGHDLLLLEAREVARTIEAVTREEKASDYSFGGFLSPREGPALS